jgi:hypothetical protein
MMKYNDLEIIIKNPSSDGNRLGSDHYMATQYGRVMLAKLEDKDGMFIEHIQEVDKTLATPEPGLYYFNLDSVDEATRAVQLTCQKMRWVSGKVTNANGSYLRFSQAISLTDVAFRNLVLGEYSAQQDKVYINVYKDTVEAYSVTTGLDLVPVVDYWVETSESILITNDTTAGTQVLPIPDSNYISFDVIDQDQYTLRRDLDYKVAGSNIILSNWTPAHQTLTMVGRFRRNPMVVGFVSAENLIDFRIENGAIVKEQFSAIATAGNYKFSDLTQGQDKNWYLTNLLIPGDNLVWECRVDMGQTVLKGLKNALNMYLIPGVAIVIGDKTVVGDQLAMLVNPTVCETYEIYGSKENIKFDIDIRTNDMRTSSEIAGLVKEYLLVSGRDRMETCGLTIYEVSRSTTSDSKEGGAGLLSTQIVTLSVSAAADWEIKRPLITRLDNIDTTTVAVDLAYPGKKVTINPIGTSYGSSGFLPSYS